MQDTERKKEYGFLWLCCVPGLYEADRKKLLRAFGTPEAVRMAALEEKEAFAFLSESKRRAIFSHARTFQAEEAYHKLLRQGIHFISHVHRDYPQGLMRVGDYPSGLFYTGGLPVRGEPCVAVVGARMCTYNGKKNAEKLAARLAENGVAVVSGMAYGIDARAQEACLDAGGKSYAVLGCGVDVCYPRENRALYQRLAKEGGLLSEYCPGTQPQPFHFPMRNRLISALADMVVVVEARAKSGTLITADMALEQGKDVYAFPGRPQDTLSAGCNRLIQQGAGMINDIEEFLSMNGYERKPMENLKKTKLGLATPENMLYSILDSESMSLQSLAAHTSLSAPELMSALGALQAKGLVTEIAKNHYARAR